MVPCIVIIMLVFVMIVCVYGDIKIPIGQDRK